jgi:Matrixin
MTVLYPNEGKGQTGAAPKLPPVRFSPRFLALVFGLVLALTAAEPAFAAPTTGFYVFKDMRGGGIVEFRDAATGRLIEREVTLGEDGPGTACTDSHHTTVGARWKAFEPFFVNTRFVPDPLTAAGTLADLRSAHSAWEDPFVTDCPNPPGGSEYEAIYGGRTTAGASLASLEFDGVNAVAFGRLEGTFCAGPGVVACVVAFSKAGTFTEADLLIESNLAAELDGDYIWTNGDTTDADSEGGQLALVDVATHEFGHWAGLGHVKNSPFLTMYPAVRDGMQTLGLGDMKGLLARY